MSVNCPQCDKEFKDWTEWSYSECCDAPKDLFTSSAACPHCHGIGFFDETTPVILLPESKWKPKK